MLNISNWMRAMNGPSASNNYGLNGMANTAIDPEDAALVAAKANADAAKASQPAARPGFSLPNGFSMPSLTLPGGASSGFNIPNIVNRSGSDLGGIFSRMGNKNAPQNPSSSPVTPPTDARVPYPNTGPDANGNYARFDNTQRSALLNAMVNRARGGQPGGGPNTPLPTPGSYTPPTI